VLALEGKTGSLRMSFTSCLPNLNSHPIQRKHSGKMRSMLYQKYCRRAKLIDESVD